MKKLGKRLSFLTKIMLVAGLLISNLSSLSVVFAAETTIFVDVVDEKLGYKMRESQTRKIPYTLVIGDKERDGNLVNYRMFGTQETVSLSVSDFINKIQEEINLRKSN